MSEKLYKITIIVTISVLLLFLFHSVSLENYDNFFPVGTTIILIFLPLIIEKILKIEIPNSLKIFFIIFLFASKFLGGNNFYYSTVFLYDKIIHTVYGIFAFFLSIFILIKSNSYNKNKMFFNIAFIISFILATSVLWEFLEFGVDKLLHKNGQRLETGISDTMFDLLGSFAASIILSIFYFIETKFKKNWLINKYINSIK